MSSITFTINSLDTPYYTLLLTNNELFTYRILQILTYQNTDKRDSHRIPQWEFTRLNGQWFHTEGYIQVYLTWNVLLQCYCNYITQF